MLDDKLRCIADTGAEICTARRQLVPDAHRRRARARSRAAPGHCTSPRSWRRRRARSTGDGFPEARAEALSDDEQLRSNLATPRGRSGRSASRVVAELPDWEALRGGGRRVEGRGAAQPRRLPARARGVGPGSAAASCTGRATAAEANRIVAGLVAGDRRRRGREGQVAHDRRDRPERGARRARDRRGRDRPRGADRPARRRHHPRTSSFPRSTRTARRSASCSERDARRRGALGRARSARRGGAALPARALPPRPRRDQRRELRRRGDRHRLRRRVGGQRAHVHDAARDADHGHGDREGRPDARRTSRSFSSCCRARRRPSG